MDFELSDSQQELLNQLYEVVEACGGVDRALDVTRSVGDDAELDAKLEASALFDNKSVLERILVVEEASRLGLSLTLGMRALVADLIPGLPAGGVAITDSERDGPIRFGAGVTTLITLAGSEAYLVPVGRDGVTAIRSSFSYPYVRIAHTDGVPLPEGLGTALRARWRLKLAAEIAGNAASAIMRTSTHLQDRQQFGKPLATFQALRHRLANVAVDVEATRWLAREAAYFDDPQRARLVAVHALAAAANAVPELTQMCGARSFSLEFGLHLYVMRMEASRLELGGPDRVSEPIALV